MAHMLQYVSEQMTESLNPRKANRPYKAPKKVRKPDGKQERQMLMGMALGLHVLSMGWNKVSFILKQRLEAQILLCLVAPFLVVPVTILSIPVVCLAIPILAMAGVSAQFHHMASIQTVLERQSLTQMESRFLKSPNAVQLRSGSCPPSLKRLATRDLFGKTTPSPSTRMVTTPKVMTTTKSSSSSSSRVVVHVPRRTVPSRSVTFHFGGAHTSSSSTGRGSSSSHSRSGVGRSRFFSKEC